MPKSEALRFGVTIHKIITNMRERSSVVNDRVE